MKEFKNTEFSYWVGLFQSDGSLKKHSFLRNGKLYVNRTIEFSVNDLILVKRFQEISNSIFNRKAKIFYRSCGMWTYHFGVKKILPKISKLNILSKYPPIPPKWIIDNDKFFGAYLAGLIDGDGNVRVKRKKYPQCAIRIISGSPQDDLKKAIENKLNCSVSIIEKHRDVYFKKQKRRIKSTYYNLEFLVSPKNFEFLVDNVNHMITLDRKREVIEKYIKKRSGPNRI